MKLKYIMYEATHGGHGRGSPIKQRIPVLFPEPLVHAVMHDALIHSDALPPSVVLISAGFYDTNTGGVYGYSESLKQQGHAHEPLSDDNLTISTYDYIKGIQES